MNTLLILVTILNIYSMRYDSTQCWNCFRHDTNGTWMKKVVKLGSYLAHISCDESDTNWSYIDTTSGDTDIDSVTFDGDTLFIYEDDKIRQCVIIPDTSIWADTAGYSWNSDSLDGQDGAYYKIDSISFYPYGDDTFRIYTGHGTFTWKVTTIDSAITSKLSLNSDSLNHQAPSYYNNSSMYRTGRYVGTVDGAGRCSTLTWYSDTSGYALKSKMYIDSSGLFLRLLGGTMAGAIDMNENNVKNARYSFASRDSFYTVPGENPSIYSSARYPGDYSGSFPFNNYREIIIQGGNRSAYNNGFCFVSGSDTLGGYANITVKFRIDEDGTVYFYDNDLNNINKASGDTSNFQIYQNLPTTITHSDSSDVSAQSWESYNADYSDSAGYCDSAVVSANSHTLQTKDTTYLLDNTIDTVKTLALASNILTLTQNSGGDKTVDLSALDDSGHFEANATDTNFVDSLNLIGNDSLALYQRYGSVVGEDLSVLDVANSDHSDSSDVSAQSWESYNADYSDSAGYCDSAVVSANSHTLQTKDTTDIKGWDDDVRGEIRDSADVSIVANGRYVVVIQNGVRVDSFIPVYSDTSGYALKSKMFTDSAGLFIRKDGSVTYTGNQDMGDNDIINIEKTETDSLQVSTRAKFNCNAFLSPVAAAHRYCLLDTDASGTGVFCLQAGKGSAGFGGALNLFSHSHATKPGWATIGISSNAGSGATEGRFTVNSQGLAGGTDIFTVLRTGNVAIGDTIASEKLDINGNCKADTFKYSAAMTRYVNIGGAAFVCSDGKQHRWVKCHENIYADSANGFSPYFIAEIQLPDKCVVTEIQSKIWDITPTCLGEVALWRYNQINGGSVRMAIVTTVNSDSLGYYTEVDASISAPTVTADSCSYAIKMHTTGGGDSIKFYGCRIKYTVLQPLP